MHKTRKSNLSVLDIGMSSIFKSQTKLIFFCGKCGKWNNIYLVLAMFSDNSFTANQLYTLFKLLFMDSDTFSVTSDDKCKDHKEFNKVVSSAYNTDSNLDEARYM